MKLFMSYYSQEEAEAEDIAARLGIAFGKEGLEVFMSARPESVAPGDDWQKQVINAIGEVDALLVLMSVDALSRPWINFEIGFAWAKSARILLFCHKGMTPSALPSPYNSLQALDMNRMGFEERMNFITATVSAALGIRESTEPDISDIGISPSSESFASIRRGWGLRPGGHIGETAVGDFLVGAVRVSRPDRAAESGLKPGDSLFVRLFYSTPEGPFINAMVAGDVATFFENVPLDTVRIKATIRLAGLHDDGDSAIPLLLIDESEVVE